MFSYLNSNSPFMMLGVLSRIKDYMEIKTPHVILGNPFVGEYELSSYKPNLNLSISHYCYENVLRIC